MTYPRRLLEWWRTFRLGEPCPKHPGHRVREINFDLIVPGHDDMCFECWCDEARALDRHDCP